MSQTLPREQMLHLLVSQVWAGESDTAGLQASRRPFCDNSPAHGLIPILDNIQPHFQNKGNEEVLSLFAYTQ